jgi:hypothetical protein
VTACLVAAEHELMLPPKVLPTALFVALVLAASLYGLAASGHFPRSAKAPAPGVGAPVLFGSIVVVLACAVAGITAALTVVPWYVAVIGGGSAILAAPLVLQSFPDRFVDGRGALVAFAAVCAVTALLLIWSVGDFLR